MQNVKQFTVVRNGITFFLFLFLPLFGVIIHSSEVKAKPFAYVTNKGSDNVSVIDTATNIPVDTIRVGDSPQGVAITPDGSRAYVANQVDGTVSVINTATNTLLAPVDVGVGPFGVAITPDGSRVYVTNEVSDTVSVINTSDNSVETITLPGGSSPLGVAITTDGTRAYVVNGGSDTVSVIDTQLSDPVTLTFNTVVDTVTVGFLPSGVAGTPDGTRVYVADFSLSLFSGTVSVINTADNSVETIDLGVFDFPTGVAITPDGSLAYVANPFTGTVSVIDTATNSVIADPDGDSLPGITVESFPSGVAGTPDGTRVYVANNGAGTVSVIDTSNNMVVDTVSVGSGPFSGPFWVAITPDAGTGDFAYFTIERARVKLGKKPDTDRFEVRGRFEWGTTSDGLDELDDVLNEKVTVTFDGFEETIPAGYFVWKKKHFEYEGPKNGAITKIKLKYDGKKDGEEDGVIEFRIKARGLDLGSIDLTSSVPFSLQIGDDLGETDIPFDKKGHFRE